MEIIAKDKYAEVLQKLVSESSTKEVEITTFDFETVKGVVTKFYLDEYEQATVVIEDDSEKFDIEIDFIRDLTLN
jgi:hypothetical protein